jgi:hypothetical protein
VKTRCYSELKKSTVVCYKLTEKGKFVVECLKRIYEALGLKVEPA